MAIRARILKRDPLCPACLARGIVRPSTQVDHILALVNGGTDADDNLQGICDDCHEAKTRADLGMAPKGCDEQGWPTDPRHHWMRG